MTGRHPKKATKVVTITPAMIEAAKRSMALFDPEFGSWAEGAERVLAAALEAGGYFVQGN